MKNLNKNFKKKSLIIINLFLIFTLMTVSVYSWFASHVDNRVDAYDVQVHADNDLELSFDGQNWSNSLKLNEMIVDGFPVTQRLNMVEITSDGFSSFLKPQLTQMPNYAIVYENGNWNLATVNKDFIQLNINFRAVDKLNVYLSSDSLVLPNSTKLIGADAGNKSDLGDFSKDCVVGALRVGFKNTSGTSMVWITNPEFHLNNEVGSTEHTMTKNVPAIAYNATATSFVWNNPLEHMYYIKNSSNTYELKTLPAAQTLTSLPETVNNISADASKTLLTTLEKANESDPYFVGKAVINIWIEGCDTEARKALVGGEFNLSLAFDSYPVK